MTKFNDPVIYCPYIPKFFVEEGYMFTDMFEKSLGDDMYKPIVEKVLKENPGIKILMLTEFGSHLYGTNTEKSDRDYKGVYLPTMDMMMLGNIPNSISYNTSGDNTKNTNDDIDFQLFSIQYFIHQVCRGETVAIDMLHSSGKSLVMTSDFWEMFRQSRSMFYTKKLKAFVGYAKTQSEKYCIKADKYQIASDFLEFLKQYDDNDRLSYFWSKLPETNYTYFLPSDDNTKVKKYMMCGKILQSTMSVKYAYEIVEVMVAEYGLRVRQTVNNERIDWKAISHALRACYEVRSIYMNGDIEFPLSEADFLLNVKNGEYQAEKIFDLLEELVQDVNRLSDESLYPEVVDREKVDSLLLFLIKVMG